LYKNSVHRQTTDKYVGYT